MQIILFRLSQNNLLYRKERKNIKVIIIGGFLGSGKTTTILKISRYFNKEGKRTAIIVNEIGEIGLDGDTLSSPDIITQELTNGCICCTLRISMQYTLQTLEEEFKPDIVIIEPTGIAFPGQIKEEIETMGLSDLSFAPVLVLVDPCRFGTEAKEIPRFVETQIREADILCINKTDVAPEETIKSTEKILHEMNPEAQILKFSAKREDQQFENLLLHLEVSGLKKPYQEKKNSLELSLVSTYSTLYSLTPEAFNPEEGAHFIEESLQTIRDKIGEINPKFIGHVKLSLKLSKFTLKGGITSLKELPQIEFIQDQKNRKNELRLLSAVTKIPKEKLIKIVENTLEEKLLESGITFEKRTQKQAPEPKQIISIKRKDL
jgi:G3E family GTPase